MENIHNMTPIRMVAFDFDGVLADSVPIKDGAFHYLFRHHDHTTQTAALSVWNRLKGVFRRDRIQAAHQEVLGITLDDHTLDDYLQQFESQALTRTIAAPWIAGVKAFLDAEQNMPLYVVSAAPQEEVRAVIQHRNMDHYFREVYGGPVKKTTILTQLLQQEACVPHSMLFIGDSISDYRAADAVGCAFLGVIAAGKKNVFPEHVTIVPDLTNLRDFVSSP